jgi:MarR family transcriptional regulator, organic hydroperoxide resistance regulator
MTLFVQLTCAQFNREQLKTGKLPPMPRSATATATAAPLNPLALDGQLCFALYASSLAMTKLYAPLLQPLGLTYPQYLVMLALWERDGVTVSDLSQRLSLDSGTLTPLLKRLETAGLLQRLRDSADERRVLLQLSAPGRQLKARAQAVPLAIAKASGCSLDEISTLTIRLRELRQHLVDAKPRVA